MGQIYIIEPPPPHLSPTPTLPHPRPLGPMVPNVILAYTNCGLITWVLKLRLFCTMSDIQSMEGRKEMFYLTTHSTHFIYGYMASDIW